MDGVDLLEEPGVFVLGFHSIGSVNLLDEIAPFLAEFLELGGGFLTFLCFFGGEEDFGCFLVGDISDEDVEETVFVPIMDADF